MSLQTQNKAFIDQYTLDKSHQGFQYLLTSFWIIIRQLFLFFTKKEQTKKVPVHINRNYGKARPTNLQYIPKVQEPTAPNAANVH
jgi:hypothetical protein